MTDDGYTLTEMLVALFVVGLALGGMTEGLRAIGRWQGATGQTLVHARAFNGASEGLEQLLADVGPFPSDQTGAFNGVASGFSFQCGRSDPCGAALYPSGGGLDLRLTKADGSSQTVALRGVQSARFTYAGTYTFGPEWPAQSNQSQTLRTIGLVAVTKNGEVPLASVRLWLEQGPNCQFDPITRACRGQTG